jgi:hypothetical protein
VAIFQVDDQIVFVRRLPWEVDRFGAFEQCRLTVLELPDEGRKSPNFAASQYGREWH